MSGIPVSGPDSVGGGSSRDFPGSTSAVQIQWGEGVVADSRHVP